MKRDALICARYWRNALADAELGRGSFRNEDVADFVHVQSDDLRRGQIGADALAILFSGKYAEADSRTVLLCPIIYRTRTLHGRRYTTISDVLTPIVSSAMLYRNGRLSVSAKTVVPCDVLEPLDRNAHAIGTVEALDDFLTLHPGPGIAPEEEAGEGLPPVDWETYRRYCEKLEQAVFPELAGDDRFELADGGFIEARELVQRRARRHLCASRDIPGLSGRGRRQGDRRDEDQSLKRAIR